MLKVYGIPNCDTVKKARKWLEENQYEYQFHDFRKDGLAPAIIELWLQKTDDNLLLNRRSTTWKQLSESDKAAETRAQKVALMVAHPTLIKRPVIDFNGSISVGFKPDTLNLFLTEQMGK